MATDRLRAIHAVAEAALNGPKPEALTGTKTKALMEIRDLAASDNAPNDEPDPDGPRVERGAARGQRRFRQPWKAWNRQGRYLGEYGTQAEAREAAAQVVEVQVTDAEPDPDGPRDLHR
jgi:hypothetical protein